MFMVNVLLGKYAEMNKEALHARDPESRGPDMPALPSESPPLRGQAIVCRKRDNTTSKNPDAFVVSSGNY